MDTKSCATKSPNKNIKTQIKNKIFKLFLRHITYVPTLFKKSRKTFLFYFSGSLILYQHEYNYFELCILKLSKLYFTHDTHTRTCSHTLSTQSLKSWNQSTALLLSKNFDLQQIQEWFKCNHLINLKTNVLIQRTQYVSAIGKC